MELELESSVRASGPKRKSNPTSSDAGTKSRKCIHPTPTSTSFVKDLRIRRIPAPNVNNYSLPEKDEDEDEDEEQGNGLLKNSDPGSHVAPTDLKMDKSAEYEGPILKTKMAVKYHGTRKIFKNPGSFSYRRLLPYLMDDESTKHLPHRGGVVNESDQIKENADGARRDAASKTEEAECRHMTPPDPDILSKMMALGQDGETNQIYQGSSIDSKSHPILKQSVDAKQCLNSINKPVLNPCPRLRVFKNPQSLSYRRLLPFLMNMSQETSSSSSVSQQIKLEFDFKEDEHLLSSTAEQNNVTTAKTEKQNTEVPKMNLHSDEVPTADGSSFGTDSHPGSSMPSPSHNNDSSHVELSSVCSGNPPDQYMPLDLQKEVTSESESSPSQLEPQVPQNDIDVVILKQSNSTIPPCSTADEVITTQSTSEESGQAMIEKCLGVVDHGQAKKEEDQALGIVEVHNIKNGDVNSNQSSSESDVSDVMVTPTYVPSNKGILKRNPRGCRGPCNCLNCASFRLHAERAFEFSRNQLHDAADIASGLMTELANLRLMLGKTVANENGLAVLQLSPVQVRQACSKAQQAEDEAKACLRQLNYDLDVHCRIPALVQPKVTFGKYVEERTVRKDEVNNAL